MKKILILIVSLLLMSCSEQDCGCTNYDAGLTLALKDAEGNNLINASNYNDIEVRYLIDGVSRDGQRPVLIEDDFGTRIGITLNNEKSEQFPVTYIIWNDNDTDTIKASFRNRHTMVDKVWINNQLIDRYESPGYFYTLVK